MKILVIGGGGREHALAWKAAQSAHVEKVYVAPGNGGTAREPGIENVPINVDDIGKLVDFARQQHIDLSLVGPEAPLVMGIVDSFRQAGLAIFGPTQAAAQLEGSKVFAKNFLQHYGIPSAAYQSFTQVKPAMAYIQTRGHPPVIKADGLAAGKGVIIAHTRDQANSAIQNMLVENSFGAAGRQIIIEDYLQGEEVSFICMVDGEHILPLATSQDHKARGDGDLGPNTGGMGAYSPAPVVTPEQHDRIMREIIEPTVNGMKARGTPYTGFLYAGLMISPSGEPKVLEFNCRFGDPEAQPIMLRLQSDLVTLCQAALAGRLDTVTANWDPRPAIGIVLASGGYPEAYSKGRVIQGLSQLESNPDATNDNLLKVFHAGSSLHAGQLVTSGGRVLCVTCLGDSVSDAQQRAYAATRKIHWQDMYYRTDIGHRAVTRERSQNR
jgi:phosphoribosylamine--glycine ligase